MSALNGLFDFKQNLVRECLHAVRNEYRLFKDIFTDLGCDKGKCKDAGRIFSDIESEFSVDACIREHIAVLHRNV